MIKLNGYQIKIKNFPAGEIFFSEELHPMLREGERNGIQHIEWKFENDAEFMAVNFLIDHIERVNKTARKLTIHYMPHARMDRLGDEKIPFALKSFVRQLATLDVSIIEVISPHSLVTWDLLQKYRPHRLNVVRYIEPQLLSRALMQLNRSIDEVTLVYPDEGAKERYVPMFRKFDYLVGEKVRDFETGRIKELTLDQIEVQKRVEAGKTFIIVDDICSYGGTFSRILKQLPGYNHCLVVAHLESVFSAGMLFDDLKNGKVGQIIAGSTLGWIENEAVKSQIDFINNVTFVDFENRSPLD